MKRVSIAALIVAGCLTAGVASAQDPPEAKEVRPAIASYWGDTGLWFVPTAEVLRPKGWSFGVYRTSVDFNQGFSNVSYWPTTLAVGVGRAEIFGAARTVTRIDRDTRPLFVPGASDDGGVVNEYPFVREGWTGSHFGDLYVGTKVNLISEHRRQPFAIALRGTMKMPTGDSDSGVGTGEFDYFADAIMSKELGRRVEISGFTGMAWRGDPDDVSLSDGLRWGLGAAFGARSNLRFTTELHGEKPFDDRVIVNSGSLIGIDGSTSPIISDLDSRANAAFGLTWQHSSGVALGIGVNYRFGLDQRSEALPQATDVSSDAWQLQFRIGVHRGVRLYVPPAPPPIAAAPAPEPPPAVVEAPRPAPAPPPANRRPTVRAQCDPCRIEVGREVTIRAAGQDPDGDTLNYRWGTPAGTIADSRAVTTRWTAETPPGTVTLNVTVDDGKGGTATDSIAIEVVRPPVVASLDDIFFDLDKATLRSDATPVLTRAVKMLSDDSSLRLHIEGNASEEGTPEYNKALGERRAQAVRDYLSQHGVDPSRLNTVSYGEEKPKYDNSKEATRRLNRRAALVIEGQN